jgi:hypothetical protein
MNRQLPPDVRALLIEKLGAALAAAYVRQQQSANQLKEGPREEREEATRST